MQSIALNMLDSTSAVLKLRNLYSSLGTSAPMFRADAVTNRIIVSGTVHQIEQTKQILWNLDQDHHLYRGNASLLFGQPSSFPEFLPPNLAYRKPLYAGSGIQFTPGMINQNNLGFESQRNGSYLHGDPSAANKRRDPTVFCSKMAIWKRAFSSSGAVSLLHLPKPGDFFGDDKAK